jgi:hypothetical protein
VSPAYYVMAAGVVSLLAVLYVKERAHEPVLA